jgi:hypothetical protein
MSEIVETLLRRNLHEVFGERDEGRRRSAMAELMTDDVIFSDHNARHTGRDAVNAAVTALQARFPGFVFTERTPPQTLTDAGTLHWQFGPPAAPKINGTDFIVVRDGRIAALYVFLEPPEGGA